MSDQTAWYFPRDGSFEKRFPFVETLHITVEQDRDCDYLNELTRFTHMGKDDIRRVACGNPRCHRGGFDVGIILDRMLRDRETRFEDSFPCCGDEGSSKRKKAQSQCSNMFHVTVEVTYRD